MQKRWLLEWLKALCTGSVSPCRLIYRECVTLQTGSVTTCRLMYGECVTLQTGSVSPCRQTYLNWDSWRNYLSLSTSLSYTYLVFSIYIYVFSRMFYRKHGMNIFQLESFNHFISVLKAGLFSWWWDITQTAAPSPPLVLHVPVSLLPLPHNLTWKSVENYPAQTHYDDICN